MMKNDIADLEKERDEIINDLERINTKIEDNIELQELLAKGDASALRIKYRTLNDTIDKGRLPGRDCSMYEARTQRRVVVARLEEIEQTGC